MSVRRVSILLLAGISVLAACNSTGGNAKDTSTTRRTVSTSNPTAGPTSSTTTEPRTPFATGFPQMQQTLAAAKGDPCKLYDFSAVLNSVSNPETTDEKKEAVDVLVQYFGDIADVLQTDHADEAASLRSETAKFSQQAAAANYNLEDPSLSALNDKPFQQAFATFQQVASGCATTTTGAKP